MTGKMVVSGKAAEPITRANTDYTKRTISAVFPDYLFMFNSSAQNSPDITEICRDGGATANEPIRESYRFYQSVESLGSVRAISAGRCGDCPEKRRICVRLYEPPVRRYVRMLTASSTPFFSRPVTIRGFPSRNWMENRLRADLIIPSRRITSGSRHGFPRRCGAGA